MKWECGENDDSCWNTIITFHLSRKVKLKAVKKVKENIDFPFILKSAIHLSEKVKVKAARKVKENVWH